MSPARDRGAAPVISRKALNRALLARQLLLERRKVKVVRVVEQLVGLQAQQAKPPFIGLWSRIAGFGRADLIRPLTTKEIVRVTAMRGTLHLMSAGDYIALRAGLQSMLSKGMEQILRDRVKGVDIPTLIAVARRHLEARPQTFADLRLALAKQFPTLDERAMGYAVRTHLPLVQVPTDAEWGFPGGAVFAPADRWLDRAIAADPDLDQLVLRYLAGFGPATAADVQTWSGLTGVGPVLERLRPKLTSLRDEKGRELFDLPKAPRPDEEEDAPVRFVPEYDNLVLAHADRSRIVADQYRSLLVTKNLQVKATFLVDGFVAGTWKTTRQKATATLLLEPFEALSKAARAELEREGEALLGFTDPDTDRREIAFAKAIAR